MWVAVFVIIGSACGRIGFDANLDVFRCATGGSDVGLVAWWKLDEGTGTAVRDSAGSTDGTFLGGPITWQPGVCGSALQFTGNGSVIDFGAPAVLAQLPSVTVSAWVRPSSIIPNGQSQGVFDKGEPMAGWTIESARDQDGDFSFVVLGATELRHTSVANKLVLDHWSHIVATWDGSMFAANIHLYLDGSEVAYGAATDATTPRADDSQVGAEIDANSGTNFAGLIDEVRIYDRVLTAVEVAQL